MAIIHRWIHKSLFRLNHRLPWQHQDMFAGCQPLVERDGKAHCDMIVGPSVDKLQQDSMGVGLQRPTAGHGFGGIILWGGSA